MFTFEAIQILIFLIPGFISAKFLDALVVRKQEQKELDTIIESLIFSMLIYTVYSFTSAKSPVTMDTTKTIFSYEYETTSFLWLIAISSILPILLAWIINNDSHMRIVRWF